MGVTRPCDHLCDLKDLEYPQKGTALKRITCRVCKRTWTLLDAVPEKGWPQRWFINCPPNLPHIEKFGRPQTCRVVACPKSKPSTGVRKYVSH
jgi:hypothetical protein